MGSKLQTVSGRGRPGLSPSPAASVQTKTTAALLKQCDGFTAGWLCFHIKNINVFEGWWSARALLRAKGTKGQLFRGLNTVLSVPSDAGLHFEMHQTELECEFFCIRIIPDANADIRSITPLMLHSSEGLF